MKYWKQIRLWALLLAVLVSGGCSAGNRRDAAVLSFPGEISSVEATFDFYPSETTRALSGDEIAAVTQWALALELEQTPLDEAETPDNYAGGAGWHFNVNSGELVFSYAEYGAGAILIGDEWYAVKNPSNPPVEADGSRVMFGGSWIDAGSLSEETLGWLAWYNSLSEEERLSVNAVPADLLEESGIFETRDMEAAAD